ncbi:quinol oxidase subunit 4 [Chryseobacterium sp. CBSDS_008]|uniref:quinol oxidase subunit 4 n=1 Tax=Chryseobacterium sp. CBSDS_008 TaxID=3415265 RepID=UPI003CF3CA5B
MKNMVKITGILIVALMLSSCVVHDNNGNRVKTLPPGQAKKVFGGSAKDYAPGQVKKRGY